VKGRRFILLRVEDESGVSGAGVVADGCKFPNGRIALTWRKPPFAMTWHLDMDEIEIHGHGGRTRVHWVDHPAGAVGQALDNVAKSIGNTKKGSEEVPPFTPESFTTRRVRVCALRSRFKSQPFVVLLRAYSELGEKEALERVQQFIRGRESFEVTMSDDVGYEFAAKAWALRVEVLPVTP
jgi:hypothetical protein